MSKRRGFFCVCFQCAHNATLKSMDKCDAMSQNMKKIKDENNNKT